MHRARGRTRISGNGGTGARTVRLRAPFGIGVAASVVVDHVHNVEEIEAAMTPGLAMAAQLKHGSVVDLEAAFAPGVTMSAPAIILTKELSAAFNVGAAMAVEMERTRFILADFGIGFDHEATLERTRQIAAAFNIGLAQAAQIERTRQIAAALGVGVAQAVTLDHAGVIPSVTTYDSGSGNYVIPSFNTFTIEAWGGGAATTSVNTSASGLAPTTSPTASTVTGTGVSISAGAGVAGNNFLSGGGAGGVGGTASGGNDTNTNGGNGSARDALTNQGKAGGASPNGGTGGAATAVYPTNVAVAVPGNSGAAPGGGAGGALQVWESSPGSFLRGVSTPSGAGAYVKSVFNAGDIAVGLSLAYAVGIAGLSNKSAAAPGGDGGAGRVRFTVA